MATPCDPIEVAFQSVIHEFKDKLQDDKLYSQILSTTSIDEVYDATDKLQKDQAKSGHLRHLSKIEPYLERLRDYSGAIDTLVQAKPDVLALIWGPIKLLIQWTSVLKQSFDAIINTTAEIGDLLPEFKEVSQRFSHNDKLKDVLVLFFQDILDFYLVTLKFFNKPRWRYIFESLWPKQRDSIKIVISHIQRHSLLMRSEVRLEHIRAEDDNRRRNLEHFEKTERFHSQQEYHNIRTAVSPEFYDSKLDWIYGRICEGSGKWLIRNSTFAKWKDVTDVSTKILWLQGIPGAGKTFLTGAVIKEVQTAGRVLFAFLSFSSSTSALKVLHSLIFQLVSDNEDLQGALSQSSRENLKNNITVAVSLLTTLLKGAGPVYIIVDGVDEIDEIERERLLRELLGLSKNCQETKIVVSSRLEADIKAKLDPVSVSIRVDEYNAGNIQAFVNFESDRLFQTWNLLPDERTDIERLLAPVAANAQGMFLYAKVLFSSIDHLPDLKSIREELRVLPENLDAAYDRILKRINSLPSARARKTARNILGWIGCSPTRLTIHELEQALVVDIENLEDTRRGSFCSDVVKLCGPIVEVIDEYVQFVHFTAKEYVSNPCIDGYINKTAATLDLANCCIWYLCQSHHDAEISDDEIARNLISGDYRLHNYAATMWLALVECYVSLNGSKPLHNKLIHALDCLARDRSNSEFVATTTESVDRFQKPSLEKFKDEWPKLHALLLQTDQFHWRCSNLVYHLSKGNIWTGFDPLAICHTSISISMQFERLLCKQKNHERNCGCKTLARWYGQRPFKCDILGCSFRRHGFTTKVLRDSHVRHHDRPWKCSVSSCQYAEIGFLSRRMRDEHLDSNHQEAKAQAEILPQNPDVNDIQPLFFDLIRLDKVEAVKSILIHFSKLASYVKTQLLELVASSGSASMAQVLCSWTNISESDIISLWTVSIENMNLETYQWFLSTINRDRFLGYDDLRRILVAVLKSGSLKIFQDCRSYLIDKILPAGPRSKTHMPLCFSTGTIESTAGNSDREHLLLSTWAILNTSDNVKFRKRLENGFTNVAKTTCSLVLAKALLEYGTRIDFVPSKISLTPLHHAARDDSPQAAELMKFLLYHGADPGARPGKGRAKEISEEKGPKNIAKWVGMSWDELNQKIKLDRERGFCPPEYMFVRKNQDSDSTRHPTRRKRLSRAKTSSRAPLPLSTPPPLSLPPLSVLFPNVGFSPNDGAEMKVPSSLCEHLSHIEEPRENLSDERRN